MESRKEEGTSLQGNGQSQVYSLPCPEPLPRVDWEPPYAPLPTNPLWLAFIYVPVPRRQLAQSKAKGAVLPIFSPKAISKGVSQQGTHSD